MLLLRFELLLGPAMVAARGRWSGEELPSWLAAAEEIEREKGKP